MRDWSLSLIHQQLMTEAPNRIMAIVLSEDLQPGMNFAGVTVRNPFT